MDKVETAIERIRTFEPKEGYYLAFSGGKDSIVCKELLNMAGVKYDAHYNNTTVDPKELIYYIREHHKDVKIENAVDKEGKRITMWNLIPRKLMPPTRMVRYCCDYFKEGGGNGRFVVTGTRWAESARRKNTRQIVEFDRYGSQSKQAQENRQIFLMSDNEEKRRMLETCQIKGKHILNPIVDWTDKEVWEFIKLRNLPYCELYDKGWERIGCIGCPLSSNQEKELNQYPKIKESYIRAFDRMIEERKKKDKETEWETGEEVMKWWIGK